MTKRFHPFDPHESSNYYINTATFLHFFLCALTMISRTVIKAHNRAEVLLDIIQQLGRDEFGSDTNAFHASTTDSEYFRMTSTPTRTHNDFEK
jgi:hypothetical protein